MPLAPGDEFAGFTIVRMLGSGGMGEVYLATHPRLPRQDALKVLRPDVSVDPSFRDRFKREADLAATLWHPNVVGVHDRGECNGQLWISMDFVDGTDAGRRLAVSDVESTSVNDVAEILTAVASALDYAHKQGLLHRDVKPANIMLTDAGEGERRILLADFGIARAIEDSHGLTDTNFTVGTVAYCAPEQLMGEELDGRTDQYALAATAYHLLAGSPLFPYSNQAVVIGRHLNAVPPALADTRPELAALDPVLARALSKQPDDRFLRCSDFANAFVAAARDLHSPPTKSSASAEEPTLLGLAPSTPTAQVESSAQPTQIPPVVPKSPVSAAPPRTNSPAPSRKTVGRRWFIAGGILTVVLLLVTVAVVLKSRSSAPHSLSPIAATTTQPSPASPPALSTSTGSIDQHRDIAGMVVMLDPGLGGVDVADKRVPNGRGGTTNCQAVSSTTDDGYPDHAFNWDTTLILRQMLTQLGVRTAMTRGGKGYGPAPCDDERARIANTLSIHPDAIVSIGAYYGPPAQRGFVVAYSDPPVNDVQAGPALQLANTMKRELTQAGLDASTQSGAIDGLAARSDLALLNLAEYPAIQVELGNLHNAEDAALMSTERGRRQYADAVARGIAAFLSSR